MKKSAIAIATTLVLSTSLALASESTYYIGVDAGLGGQLKSTATAPNSPDNPARAMHELAYGVRLGTLSAENVKGMSYGLEVGITNYGDYLLHDANNTQFTVKSASLNYMGVIRHGLVDSGFGVFAKAGVAYVMEQDVPSGGGTSYNTENQFVPMFAAGVDYAITSKDRSGLSIGVTYQAIVNTIFGTVAPLPSSNHRTAGQTGDNALLFNINFLF